MLVKRESNTGANDLHTVFRPCTLDEVFGNRTNINILKHGLSSGNLSHCFLFTGDAGCGKTTVAKVLALGIQCEAFAGGVPGKTMTSTPCLHVDHKMPNDKKSWCQSCRSIINDNSIDVQEINVGATGGKDAVDKIVNNLPSAPFNSRHKVVIFDEAHKLTPAAQDLLLKVIETGFSYVYFIFCTNHPEKLSDAFITRCNVMHFGRISKDLIGVMLKNVAEFEAMSYTQEALDYIAEESAGVPRSALVWLKQINDEASWSNDSVKEIIGISLCIDDPEIIEISKVLLKGHFKSAVSMYDKIKSKNQAEGIRIGVTGYMVGCLKRTKKVRDARKFSAMLDFLTIPIYEQGKLADHKFINYMFKITDHINDPNNYIGAK